MAPRRIPLSWVVASTAVALVAAGVFVLVADGSDDSDASGDSAAGEMELVPEGELPANAGEVVLSSLSDEPDTQLGTYLGTRPVIVNFFASWCNPCLDEMPAFQRVYEDVGDQVGFVGLAAMDRPSEALDTVERTGVTYPTYIDADGSALAFFEAANLPTTVLVAADGTILATSYEELSEQQLRDLIAEHYGIAA